MCIYARCNVLILIHVSLCIMYIGSVAITRDVSSFGTPSNPIFLDNLACIGSETAILDCPRGVLGLHQCDHSQDAGVQCFGRSCHSIDYFLVF